MKSILILGGGFGGLYTALRLTEFNWGDTPPEITLVDKSDRFLFSPLLYELITEEMQPWEIAPYYTDLLADTKIKFIHDEVTKINLLEKSVNLANNPSLNYDKLVIALGGSTPIEMVKGAKENAIPFRTLNDAYRLKEKLRNLENSEVDKIRVAIVGGGYSGVELGVKIAERLGEKGRIRIIDKGEEILKESPEFNRKTAEKILSEAKIWVDLETEITEITENEISLIYKEKVDIIPVDLVLWTVGTTTSKVSKKLNLPANERGKLTVNQQLQLENYPDVFAVGDLAEFHNEDGKILSANAQVAYQQSGYCGWNVWASLENKPLLDFRYQPLGEMLALGMDKATISGMGISLDGNLAYLARRLIYLYRLPTLKHQLAVGLNWLTAPLSNIIK